MEGEIFGFYKTKQNLLSRSERDSRRHDHVNFVRPCVNNQLEKSHVQI
jgi:hypothetical protein